MFLSLGTILNLNFRAVAILTVPGGQEFHLPHFFLKFRSIFLSFPQTFLIFFLILAIRVGESPTREGPGYATAQFASLTRAYLVPVACGEYYNLSADGACAWPANALSEAK